jgi:hypothetical protein
MVEPITPPPGLVQQWWEEADQHVDRDDPETYFDYVATQAARWGADQELEACCDWVSQWRFMIGGNRPEVGLRAARRPKPPSLKEQVERFGWRFAPGKVATLRRALEQLDD